MNKYSSIINKLCKKSMEIRIEKVLHSKYLCNRMFESRVVMTK